MIFPQGSLSIAFLQKSKSEIVMSSGVVRVQAKCLTLFCDLTVQVPSQPKHDAKRDVRIFVLRVEAHRFARFRDNPITDVPVH